MGSYLTFSPYSTGSIEITGLTPGEEYTMYLYSQANQNTTGRIDDFDANGVDVSTTQVNPDTLNTFVLGQNYTVASDVVADVNGDINVAITVPGNLTYEGDVNGFQLVGGGESSATPEPTTAGLMLLALGAGTSLLQRRRQSR
jgi:hypothetical protein